MKNKIALSIISLLFFLNTNAQCAMCRAVLESEDGQNAAKGINDGIVYLMIIPYLLIGGLGYIIYLKFFKTKKVQN
jgi:hypothetical protein